jgi:hypothetical protein
VYLITNHQCHRILLKNVIEKKKKNTSEGVQKTLNVFYSLLLRNENMSLMKSCANFDDSRK